MIIIKDATQPRIPFTGEGGYTAGSNGCANSQLSEADMEKIELLDAEAFPSTIMEAFESLKKEEVAAQNTTSL